MAESKNDAKGKQALVLDDSRAGRMILRKFLTDLGFKVTEAETAHEGLQSLKKGNKFEVMLVDGDLRGINGLEFIRRVRADEDNKSTPIIMLSSQSSRDRMMEAIEAGANEYIIKPFNKEALETKLELLGIESR